MRGGGRHVCVGGFVDEDEAERVTLCAANIAPLDPLKDVLHTPSQMLLQEPFVAMVWSSTKTRSYVLPGSASTP